MGAAERCGEVKAEATARVKVICILLKLEISFENTEQISLTAHNSRLST